MRCIFPSINLRRPGHGLRQHKLRHEMSFFA
jgi:hypothetical protein